MSIVTLTGFMGTGKTTVGRLLADRLGKPFVDTDQRIEQLEGCPVASIFVTKGEAYFRTLERRVVAAAVTEDAVVATGGGAIVDAENYRGMHAAGPIVCLTADVDVILERTANDSTRPLLDRRARASRVRQLLAARTVAYGQADLTINTSRRSAEAVVDEILAFLRHGGGSPEVQP